MKQTRSKCIEYTRARRVLEFHSCLLHRVNTILNRLSHFVCSGLQFVSKYIVFDSKYTSLLQNTYCKNYLYRKQVIPTITSNDTGPYSLPVLRATVEHVHLSHNLVPGLPHTSWRNKTRKNRFLNLVKELPRKRQYMQKWLYRVNLQFRVKEQR